jgi:hypothetical protein
LSRPAHLDPADYIRQRLTGTRPTHAWSTGVAEDTVSWQVGLRAVLGAVIGLPDEEPPAPEARYGKAEVLDGYTRSTVRFTTRLGLDAVAYLLVPNGAAAPRPAILCLPGHGRGVSSIVGIAADGSQRPADSPDEYAADFALRSVREGYVTLALSRSVSGTAATPALASRGRKRRPAHVTARRP